MAEPDTANPQPTGLERWRRATRYTRGVVLAEALLAVILGFTADDLELLRVPGYLAGLSVAFLVLTAGGLFHGARLNQRVASLDPDRRQEHLDRTRTRGRLAAVLMGILFVAWLIFFSQGVPPWRI